MSVSYSIKRLVDMLRPSQSLSDLAKAGIHNAVLDMGVYYNYQVLECWGEPRENAQRLVDLPVLLEQMRTHEIQLTMVKAPQLKYDTKRNDMGQVLLELGRECIAIAESAGVKYIVIPPLFAGISREAAWECNREYYLALAECCRYPDTCILLENQLKDMGGRLVRGFCFEAEEAVQWVRALNTEAGTERFGFGLDMGKCTIGGQNIQDVVKALGSHLKAVIVRDCDRYHDVAMLPFTGVFNGQSTTDWLGLIRGLRDISYEGQLVMEAGDTIQAFSPLLRPGVLSLAKSVGDFLEWQIHIEAVLKKYKAVVLFGAGNMCRNYMKCYGEQYPPLFTCDNNEKLWGTQFCGLEVKAPEALRELPGDCGVVICNVYYREIEQQLCNMGIQNIEFFNDEYMSSFYYDRL